ncbi:tRNA (uracil(54)-C(5))-methyltransferase -like protein [Brachionus plicatilis]|uniref:tRNA (Uracil(54)-C(5))-methyltransferase-like protein n=1 Tax=Brachionus plicatilis TaxID=10195 RepID=A0A3M7PK80_BRAPC|nr:tRNA (uracil(54)-C(5))-methyltransferase -like protein [Brachionus plicatilis]
MIKIGKKLTSGKFCNHKQTFTVFKTQRCKFQNLSYVDQLKIKKQDFVKAFKNVLITLLYDEKLDDDIRHKQQDFGEQICISTEDIQPLTSTNFKDILTNDVLTIGENENGEKKIGKYTRIYDKLTLEDQQNFDQENFDFIIKPEFTWKSILTKFHEADYPNDFKIISNHFEEFIKHNPLPVQKFASYYTSFWHWNKFELRKTRNGQTMLIVPFNPQNLSNEEISEQKKNLKDYFINGPGKQCKLGSLIFQVLDPKHEFSSIKKNFELLHGSEKLIENCGAKEFEFSADNYYPQVFESYEKLNVSLSEMLKSANKDLGTNRLIELDGVNGVLGSLVSDCYEKYYSIQNSQNTAINAKNNLIKNGLCEDYFCLESNLTKSMKHLKSILNDSGENSKISFVFQDFKQPMFDYQKHQKKKLLIKLRAHDQIKNILLVTNLNALFKLEQYCYELMTGERRRERIFGRPFCAVSAKLIDLKPMVSNCYAIIRLDRE